MRFLKTAIRITVDGIVLSIVAAEAVWWLQIMRERRRG